MRRLENRRGRLKPAEARATAKERVPVDGNFALNVEERRARTKNVR